MAHGFWACDELPRVVARANAAGDGADQVRIRSRAIQGAETMLDVQRLRIPRVALPMEGPREGPM
jgi:hypothetical protein